MWHKEDDEGDSYEKNDGGWKTSPHLLLPLHLTCEAVLCVVKMMVLVRVVSLSWGCLRPSLHFSGFLNNHEEAKSKRYLFKQ